MQSLNLEWFLPFFSGLAFGLAAMVLHEGGHILCALALGIKVKRVGVEWKKGIYLVRDQGPLNKNLLIALAGPMVNVVLIASAHWSPTLGLANFCYALVNLLPIEGSDGSRILQCWHGIRKRAPVRS